MRFSTRNAAMVYCGCPRMRISSRLLKRFEKIWTKKFSSPAVAVGIGSAA
jgi:hypothetical protein